MLTPFIYHTADKAMRANMLKWLRVVCPDAQLEILDGSYIQAVAGCEHVLVSTFGVPSMKYKSHIGPYYDLRITSEQYEKVYRMFGRAHVDLLS